MKKKILINVLLCCVLVSGFLGCTSTKSVQMANPFYDCASLKEAADITGFSMNLPEKKDLPYWVDTVIYRATKVNVNMLEIIYPNAENTKEIRIRKAVHTKNDISGDFNDYELEQELMIGGKKVLARINGQKIYLVTWKDGKYSYSLRLSEGGNESTFANLMNKIK